MERKRMISQSSRMMMMMLPQTVELSTWIWVVKDRVRWSKKQEDSCRTMMKKPLVARSRLKMRMLVRVSEWENLEQGKRREEEPLVLQQMMKQSKVVLSRRNWEA